MDGDYIKLVKRLWGIQEEDWAFFWHQGPLCGELEAGVNVESPCLVLSCLQSLTWPCIEVHWAQSSGLNLQASSGPVVSNSGARVTLWTPASVCLPVCVISVQVLLRVRCSLVHAQGSAVHVCHTSQFHLWRGMCVWPFEQTDSAIMLLFSMFLGTWTFFECWERQVFLTLYTTHTNKFTLKKVYQLSVPSES